MSAQFQNTNLSDKNLDKNSTYWFFKKPRVSEVFFIDLEKTIDENVLPKNENISKKLTHDFEEATSTNSPTTETISSMDTFKQGRIWSGEVLADFKYLSPGLDGWARIFPTLVGGVRGPPPVLVGRLELKKDFFK